MNSRNPDQQPIQKMKKINKTQCQCGGINEYCSNCGSRIKATYAVTIADESPAETLKNKMDKKKNNIDPYTILDIDPATKELPTGFIGVYIFIEGDTKDLRIICQN